MIIIIRLIVHHGTLERRYSRIMLSPPPEYETIFGTWGVAYSLLRELMCFLTIRNLLTMFVDNVWYEFGMTPALRRRTAKVCWQCCVLRAFPTWRRGPAGRLVPSLRDWGMMWHDPVFPKQGFSESWKCALGSCEKPGITKPGFSHPDQTFLRSRENPCFQNPCQGNPRWWVLCRDGQGGGGVITVSVKETLLRKRLRLGRLAFRAPNQGPGSSFCWRIPGQRPA